MVLVDLSKFSLRVLKNSCVDAIHIEMSMFVSDNEGRDLEGLSKKKLSICLSKKIMNDGKQ